MIAPTCCDAWARAIHAAVQARCLMPKRTEHALEEVFIGALLMNIGELGFLVLRNRAGQRT